MTIDEINKAIENREKIFVRYRAGNHYGQAREIAPVAFVDDQRMIRARCYNTNQIKTFRVEKIDILNEDEFNYSEKVPLEYSLPEFNNLKDVADYYHDTLKSLGWGVTCGEQLAVHHFYKNGKIKKGRVVSLSFSYSDGDTSFVEPSNFDLAKIPPQKRPWQVRCKGVPPVNYYHLNAAAAKFMDYVSKCTPIGKPKQKDAVDELSNLNEIQLIEHIITTRIRKEKSSFDRLTKNLIVPSVSYDKSKGTGSLNNEHWVFCVTYAFRDALDLAFQRRIEHKKTVHIWTQGPMISFKEGDLLHHKSGSIALQVKHAAAMAWDSDKNKMYYGYVNYQIFDFEKKTYMKEDKTCTQLEFLDVLINGLSIDIPNHSGV